MTTYGTQPTYAGVVQSFGGDAVVEYLPSDIDRVRMSIGSLTIFFSDESAQQVAWRLREAIEAMHENLQPIDF